MDFDAIVEEINLMGIHTSGIDVVCKLILLNYFNLDVITNLKESILEFPVWHPHFVQGAAIGTHFNFPASFHQRNNLCDRVVMHLCLNVCADPGFGIRGGVSVLGDGQDCIESKK